MYLLKQMIHIYSVLYLKEFKKKVIIDLYVTAGSKLIKLNYKLPSYIPIHVTFNTYVHIKLISYTVVF